MSALARTHGRPNHAVAIAIPYSAGFEGFFMRERLTAVRDTLIVFGLQVVFRVTMFFRHLNH